MQWREKWGKNMRTIRLVLALVSTVTMSSLAQSPAAVREPDPNALHLTNCREVTVFFRTTAASVDLVPPDFVSMRINGGRPPVWLENVTCESVEHQSAKFGPAGYTMVLAGIVPPEPWVVLASERHFYIAGAFTDRPELQARFQAAGIAIDVADGIDVSANSVDRASVALRGEKPFTVTFEGAIPTEVHSHRWYFWSSDDRGRAGVALDVSSGAGSRGAAEFRGTEGTRFNTILGGQPIAGAVSEPFSASISFVSTP
jgi:hypothetical protein